jgi:hypothetical protein
MLSIGNARAQRQTNTLTNCQRESGISSVSDAPVQMRIDALTCCEQMGSVFSQNGLSSMVDRPTYNLLTEQQCVSVSLAREQRRTSALTP